MEFSKIKTPILLAFFYIYIVASSFLLSGCTNEVTSSSEQVESVVTFSVSGNIFSDANATTVRSGEEGTSSISVTTPLDDDVSIVSTLTPTSMATTRLTEALTNGVTYRVIVYNSGGNYVTHSDFTEGSPTTHSMQITSTPDAVYTFVAYSFNTNTLPTFNSALTSTTFASAKLEDVPAGTDLLYWTETRTLHSGNNFVDIVFDHKFSQINTSADATLADANIVSYSGVTFTPNYGADLSLQSGTTIKKGLNTAASLNMGTAGTQTVAAGSYATVFPAGEKPLMIHYDAIKVGDKSFTNKTIYFNQTLTAGTQYTLTTKFADVKDMSANGTGKLAGRTCIDVMQMELFGRGSFNVRDIESNSFINRLGSNTYVFTPTSAVSNVRFTWQNIDGEPITGISGDNGATNISSPVTATVTFADNLDDLARGTKRDDGALSAYIYAIYNDKADGSGSDKSVRLKVYIQDQGCCGAYINNNKTKWATFMCHNLGVDQALDPFTPNTSLYGDFYQWGRQADGHEKRNSPTTTTLATNTTATMPTEVAGRYIINTAHSGADWLSSGAAYTRWGDGTQNTLMSKATNDPCPPGWKVPSINQWALLFKESINGLRVGSASSNATSNTWVWQNTGNGYKIGDDLYLPAASGRDRQNGNYEINPVNGYYWSSTNTRGPDGANSFYFNKTTVWQVYTGDIAYAFPVRCIAEE